MFAVFAYSESYIIMTLIVKSRANAAQSLSHGFTNVFEQSVEEDRLEFT